MSNKINFYYKKTTEDITKSPPCSKGKLQSLLDLSNELDTLLSIEFPIGEKNDTLNVPGGSALIHACTQISNSVRKIDYLCPFKDITSDYDFNSKEISFTFSNFNNMSPITANFVYSSMSSLIGLLGLQGVKNQLTAWKQPAILDFHILTLANLLHSSAAPTYLYRLLCLDNYLNTPQANNYCIRSIASNQYICYDNNLLIYVLLQTLDRLNTRISQSNLPSLFKITDFTLTDSHARIVFGQPNTIEVDGIGSVSTYVVLSNSEIRDGSVYFEICYMFYDTENNHMFNCIPPLKDVLLRFKHTLSYKNSKSTSIDKLKNIYTLELPIKSMISHIQNLSKIPLLTTELSERIYNKLDSSHLSATIKQCFPTTKSKKEVDILLANTTSLFEALKRPYSCSLSIDQTIDLERSYYVILDELLTELNTEDTL